MSSSTYELGLNHCNSLHSKCKGEGKLRERKANGCGGMGREEMGPPAISNSPEGMARFHLEPQTLMHCKPQSVYQDLKLQKKKHSRSEMADQG